MFTHTECCLEGETHIEIPTHLCFTHNLEWLEGCFVHFQSALFTHVITWSQVWNFLFMHPVRLKVSKCFRIWILLTLYALFTIPSAYLCPVYLQCTPLILGFKFSIPRARFSIFLTRSPVPFLTSTLLVGQPFPQTCSNHDVITE